LELKEQKLLVNKYKSELSFAKIEQMPDVNISASQQSSSSATTSSNQGGNGIGLSVSIPLFNRNQEKIFSAKSKIKAQELSFEFNYNRLIQLLNNDINQFETTLKLAKNFPISEINKTLARLALANSDFKKGILDFITYIELDLQEYQVIDTCLDTQLEMASSYANLMTKIGNFILPQTKD
jgi:outer membrane protein TolC